VPAPHSNCADAARDEHNGRAIPTYSNNPIVRPAEAEDAATDRAIMRQTALRLPQSHPRELPLANGHRAGTNI
jgi:hypothetical protein